MKIFNFENFLKSYGVNIYDFISYIDETQKGSDDFIRFYRSFISKHLEKESKKVPIAIVKKNIKLYEKYYFDATNPRDWIINAFSFRKNVLGLKMHKWFKIHDHWIKEVDGCNKITIFDPDQKSKISKSKKIKNLKI